MKCKEQNTRNLPVLSSPVKAKENRLAFKTYGYARDLSKQN